MSPRFTAPRLMPHPGCPSRIRVRAEGAGAGRDAPAASAALQPLDVVTEGPVLRPVPVDRPGHQALVAALPGLRDERGRHVPATGAGLCGQAGDLLVVRHPDRRSLYGQAAVEAVGLD